MATKQVKKTVVVTSKTLNTSSSESVQSPFRARSPSPARISRLQEKEQLTGLNDRLAAYIDHIRSLENENQRLHVQVQTFEETSRREVSSVKDLYEKELAAARKLIDDLAKENAQLTISVGTYKSEAEEWMRKYSLKDRELTLLQKKLDDIDCQLKDLENKLSAALRDADKAKADYQRVRVELSDLERQLASARKQLEEETLAKVDLENKVQSLKEELSFKAQLHQSELNETRTRMEYSIDEVDSRTQREVENRLQEALAEFRQQHDIQTKNLREELELLYEAKIAGLQKELETQDGADEKTRTEISIYKSKITELQSQITKLANQNATLEARVASLEADLAAERDQYRVMLDSKDREIRLIREQIEEQLLEYQDLLDIKVSLDLEIAAYRKLLEGEEERLSQSYSSVKSTPRKRRRGDDEPTSTFIEEAQSKSAFTSSGRSSGSCEISEVSEDGKYVKVKNSSSEEVSLGGWKLIQRVGNDQSDYKFTRAAKLAAGEVATIWSSDAGVSADAATHTFVMKGTKWLTGDSVQTSLTDKEGNEQASYELTKTTQRTILKGTRMSTAQPLGPDNNGRCSIM